MAHTAFSSRAWGLALAPLFTLNFPLHALAQASAEAAKPESVTVTGRYEAPPAQMAGFGDVPLARTPLQVTSINTTALRDLGIDTLGEITKLDASISDAYNAPGYWSSLRVRGFQLDNRNNYRRDGLPISGETALLLDNKERLEVLKGISGAQAGLSSPAGLANLVVKRPRGHATSLLLGWTEQASLKAAVDVDRQLGAPGSEDSLGLRVNAAYEKLSPQLRNAKGERGLLAAALQAKPSRDDVLDAEVEWSRQSQPSVPGFSLLGTRLPSADEFDPRLNLNNQAWSQPVEFEGQTASLRWTRQLSAAWQFTAHAVSQHLSTDDRLAFPYGCSAENNYDRYCSDGSFDLYDFRSEGERRRTQALALSLEGRLHTGSLQHHLSTGLQWSQLTARFGRQAYNWAGVGQVDGSVQVPAAPELTDENTQRNERSLEWHLRDRIELATDWSLWLGLRASQLDRSSVRTDGSRATRYEQRFATPWLAATWQFNPDTMAYASWGQGVETDVTPNRPRYVNPGEPLPALKSTQTEVGLKHNSKTLGWGLTVFDIQRPVAADFGDCDVDRSCTRQTDGDERHRGLEANADTRWGAWSLRGSAMWLQARREGSAPASINGLVPSNVAQRSLRLMAAHQLAALPGLTLQAQLAHEGPRYVLPDNSPQAPSWTTTNLSARYSLKAAGAEWLLRAGVDNVFDRRAWQETPYQYGHSYLYPLAPRTWRASLQVNL